jgi:hypothetical protein
MMPLAFTDADRAQLAAMDAQQRLHWLAETAGIPETPPPPPGDLDEPDEDSPLSDPQTLAGFQIWRATGIRVWNLREAEAIADATSLPLSVGEACSAFAWRLNGSGTRNGWWTKRATDWADDLGISLDQFRKVQNVMVSARLVRRHSGLNNVTDYKLDHDALNALTFAYGQALDVDFKGLAARSEGNAQTVKQKREGFHGLREIQTRFAGNAQTRIQGKDIQKPPARAVDNAVQHDGTRTPGEDDEDDNPPPTARRSAERDAITDTLTRACDAKSPPVPHKPGEIAAFVALRDVTATEAAHAAGVVRNATIPIDKFSYVKSVIENYRSNGRQRDSTTPVGGVPRENDVLPVYARMATEPKADPAIQARSVADSLNALRLHSKAFTKGN